MVLKLYADSKFRENDQKLRKIAKFNTFKVLLLNKNKYYRKLLLNNDKPWASQFFLNFWYLLKVSIFRILQYHL